MIYSHRLKELKQKVVFRFKYGFPPPPSFTDMSGYETVLDFLKMNNTHRIPGDVVEIGAFLGGGTYKLCKFYERFAQNKKIYVVDIFDPEFDTTECIQGISMREIYTEKIMPLEGKSQVDIFRSVTYSCKNLELLIGDSKNIKLPCSSISFAFIDGNHSPEYVTSDFYKVWELLSPHGVVAFDDYGNDLPQVTQAINALIGKESARIMRIHTAGNKMIFITKK